MRSILLCILLLIPGFAMAHNAQQLPFVSLNGQDAAVYPVGTSSIDGLILPQDVDPSTVLVNQPLNLVIETVNLPILPENLPNASFHWDFADETTADGSTISHTYTKIGSYTITLTLSIKDVTTEPQLLDLILVHVVPSPDYVLPKASFTINGNTTSDPYKNRLPFRFQNPLTFTNTSVAGSAKIEKYLWDFGDRTSSLQSELTHTYDSRLSYAQPLLRVTDQNGFIADALLQVENTSFTGAAPLTAITPPASPQKYWPIIGLGGILVMYIGVRLVKTAKRTRQQRRQP